MTTPVDAALLSALRRTASPSALHEIREELFAHDDARAAFRFLVHYVHENRAFPQPLIFRRHTGVDLPVTREPLSYYVGQAVERAIYRESTPHIAALVEHFQGLRVRNGLEAAREILRVESRFQARETGVHGLGDVFEDVLADYDEAKRVWGLRGITSGWAYVDLATGGWQNADLITLAGRPGVGKSYMLLYMALAAWLSGRSVLFVSMEMAALQIGRRLLGLHARINPRLIRDGRLSTYVEHQMIGCVEGVREGPDAVSAPFTIMVGNFRRSVSAVSGLCDELSPDIVFIDASYLLDPVKANRNGSRRENVADVMGDLKVLNTHLNRPIIQSVQFNRQAVRQRRSETEDSAEGGGGRRNPIAHLTVDKLGETDTVGQNSSIVIGVEKADGGYEDLRRYMGFIKGREGEQGWWTVNYDHRTMDFSYIPEGADDESVDLDEW